MNEESNDSTRRIRPQMSKNTVNKCFGNNNQALEAKLT